MYKLIDGKTVAAAVKEDVAKGVADLKNKGIGVGLAVILAGDDEASRIYVNNKKKACALVGIDSYEYLFGSDVTEKEILDLIEKLNADGKVNGILCQLPLPAGIDQNKIIAAIDPAKDVDGFHPQNAGKMLSGGKALLPCTPAGIMKMLDYYGISASGRNCVVIGRSNIVGKPAAVLLLQKNGTVTVCHSKTENMAQITAGADILVSAVGKPHFVTADMVKPGAVVIDVGINRVNGKLCGDVDFENVCKTASYITPVPGGVGPMTIAMLMYNTLCAAKEQNGIGDTL